MNIDLKTLKALEILTNQINCKETIFSILNKTHTVNGARLLKVSFLFVCFNFERLKLLIFI